MGIVVVKGDFNDRCNNRIRHNILSTTGTPVKYGGIPWSIFSTPSVGKLSTPFLLLSVSLLSLSAILSSYLTIYNGIPSPQCWPGIWRWWITFSLSSTVFCNDSVIHFLVSIAFLLRQTMEMTSVSSLMIWMPPWNLMEPYSQYIIVLPEPHWLRHYFQSL